MKTILMLNYEYPPLWWWAWVCTQYQSELLAKFGYKIIVITTWFEWEKEYEQKQNLEIFRLKSFRKFKHKSGMLEKLDWIFQTKKFLKIFLLENKVDIVFGNFTILWWQIWYFLKKKYGIPYIILSHWHDIPWFFKKQMFLYHIITYFWIKKVCNYADKIVLLTKDMKKNADNFLPNEVEKNIIIPNGCEINIFTPNKDIQSKNFTFIFVGRLVEQKDPMTFLQAIKILKNNYDFSFTAHVLWDGPLKNQMDAFVLEHHLQKEVVFHGWVSKSEMLNYYQSANLQVISSLAEAMSIATLESLSTGQYILSTPVSGNVDMIEKDMNGDFFDYGNAKELSEKIYNYYENKFQKWYSVDDKYLENFRKKYSWEEIVKVYDDLIVNLTSDEAK